MKEFTGCLTRNDPNNICVLYPVGDVDFACLVADRLKVYAELDILFLRPGEPVNSSLPVAISTIG
jgi:hypothetical protein